MAENSFVMMALGPYRFSLSTAAFQDLERNSAWRWPSVERIGARPALQYVGPGEDTVSMRGTVYPHFRGGIGQVGQMREAAAMGEPLQMVDGTGRVWGKYCITSVRESQTVFFSNGKPRKIDFDLSLSMYGDDAPVFAGFVAAVVPSAQPLIAAPTDIIATLAESTDRDNWLKRVTSSTLLSSVNARRFMTMTADGMDAFRGAVQTGYSALQGVNRTIAEVEGYRRSATALVRSIERVFSADGTRSLSNFQMSLATIIATSNGVPFLDFIDELGERRAQDGGDNIVALVTRDDDATAMFNALIEARQDV